MLHIVDTRTDVDERLEHGVGGNVAYPLTIDVDLATIANGIAILGPGTDH